MKRSDPTRSDLARATDIVQAAAEIRDYTHGMTRAEFDKSLRTKRAVTKCAEIIGEAAHHLSPKFKAAHPKIPGGDIRGARNHLAHKYWDVDTDILWDIAKKHARSLSNLLLRGPLGRTKTSPTILNAEIIEAATKAERRKIAPGALARLRKSAKKK